MARKTSSHEIVGKDCNGHDIRVGTFINFIFFWYTPSGEVERERQGRIIKNNGHPCFRYKLNGRFVTQRLSTLCYSSDDWELSKDSDYKDNIENPVIWSCQVP